ncbi:cytochrome b558/566 subunit A [Thermoproteus uzoniensis 768-20]|uniref:Cytochrome b558/566 subunit A n=1 Tax=Thermoproteus uzoniensis (strain 768-20) TaxID=999630 RepID=F2L5B1_THEU7|nr:ethylbenzene dehydrogenase-related protein [Thermoproteus uzoniensis]AEA13536.1 cytochrome b558/566 subunit A [Thermoproteus uzoniensis 768-20]
MARVKPITIVAAALTLAVGLLAVVYPIALAQAPSGIVAYRVVGSANLAAPGTESFWSQIPAYNVSLVPNLSPQMLPISYSVPTSGLVPYVMVKAAWNGTDIFILMEWPDPYGPSYAGPAAIAGPGHWTLVYNPKGPLNMTFLNILTSAFHKKYFVLNSSYAVIKGSPRPMEYVLAYMAPHYGVYFYGYYVNLTSGHYYPDRAAIMWYMGTQQNPSDCMNIGGGHPNFKVGGTLGQLMQAYLGSNVEPNTGGSLSAGAANIWEWISGATDPQGDNFAYFTNVTWDVENGIDPSAAKQFAASPHGFFINLFDNQTGLYDVGDNGIWYPNATGPEPGYFDGYTGAVYKDGYWVVEFVRPLKAPMPYTVDLTPGQTYDVAFAVWIGKAGETSWDKSISPSFIPLTIATSAPPTTTTSTTTSTTTTATTTTSTTSTTAVSAVPSAVITVAVIGVIIAVIAIGLVYYSIRRRTK